MPMYAYACKDCGYAFDVQQSFTDDSLTVCPVCSGSLRKKFDSVGVVFKGSGFYRNDSRSTTTGTDAGSSSGSPATAPSKPDSSPASSASPASPSTGSSPSTAASTAGSSSGGRATGAS